MKKYLLLTCVICVGLLVSAQNKMKKTDLLGTWKMTSISIDGGIYYDFGKDSLYISDDVKKTWTSAEDSTMAMTMSKMIFAAAKEVEMVFQADGVYIERTPRKTKEGKYSFDEASSVLTTELKSEKKINASFDKGVLRLVSPKDETIPEMILYMQKK